MIGPGWKVFTFLAQCAEHLAEAGRASWIPLEAESNSKLKMPPHGKKLLQYLRRHPDLTMSLEHREHVELSDGVIASNIPLFVFPLQTKSRLIALLAVSFPGRPRPSHETLARLHRLCGAATPLLTVLVDPDYEAGEVDKSGSPENRLQALSDANLQLEGLAQVNSHIVRNAVHDLRTPLVAIRGYARLLLREHTGPLAGAQKEYLGAMLENTERMICALNGLSEFGKNGPVRLASLDLSDLWPHLAATIQAKAREKSIRIQERFSRRPFPIVVDAEILAQALGALIPYVIQRTAEGGLVRVGFDKDEEIVIRIMTDDVCRSEGGDDLVALSPAREALRILGGGVSASGSAGGSFTVTITLPVIRWKDHAKAGGHS